jgi:hypothetical protein
MHQGQNQGLAPFSGAEHLKISLLSYNGNFVEQVAIRAKTAHPGTVA